MKIILFTIIFMIIATLIVEFFRSLNTKIRILEREQERNNELSSSNKDKIRVITPEESLMLNDEEKERLEEVINFTNEKLRNEIDGLTKEFKYDYVVKPGHHQTREVLHEFAKRTRESGWDVLCVDRANSVFITITLPEKINNKVRVMNEAEKIRIESEQEVEDILNEKFKALENKK